MDLSTTEVKKKQGMWMELQLCFEFESFFKPILNETYITREMVKIEGKFDYIYTTKQLLFNRLCREDSHFLTLYSY